MRCSIVRRKISSAKFKMRRIYLNAYWKNAPVFRSSRRHHLPSNLIVSLTSYRPRFLTMAPVLKALLSQSILPDAVILWVSHADKTFLPNNVMNLQNNGLIIKTCEDLRSYKKIVPSLREFPDSFIVTADDDILYEKDWLKTLISGYKNNKEVLFRRGHTVIHEPSSGIHPYEKWIWGNTSSEASSYSFPTGCGGVLYPPNIFDPRVTDSETFLRLAPTADDMWLYWMASLGGARFRRVGPNRYRPITVRGSQSVSLGRINNGSTQQNSIQLYNLVTEFGLPFTISTELCSS